MAEYTTVDDAGSFYNTTLYTGTGSELAITGVGFQPDWTWLANLDTIVERVGTNSVVGATKYLSSNLNTEETTDAQSLKSFDSDGFTVGTMAAINTSTEDMVSWNWKAGTTSGLSGGTITPAAYSINTTSGFGAFSYTGTGSAGTIAHGLGVAPTAMIIKQRSLSVKDWYCYHQNMPAGSAGYHVTMNTDAAQASGTEWNSTDPDATVFTLGANSNVNGASDTYIAYVFAPVQGFSKFGYYIGNAQADGPFVATGFRPAFVMLKYGTGAAAWNLFDSKRSTSGKNVADKMMQPNDGNAQITATDGVKTIDINANGFKVHSTNAEFNGSGYHILYWAFAEAPFVNSSGIPVNAR